MTARRPLVIVNGLQQELPAGDNITDPVLAAISQIAGLNGTTLLEVEAKYGAARIVLRPNDGGSLIEQAFDVGHYAMGISGELFSHNHVCPHQTCSWELGSVRVIASFVRLRSCARPLRIRARAPGGGTSFYLN
jgi:hypothetical protein